LHLRLAMDIHGMDSAGRQEIREPVRGIADRASRPSLLWIAAQVWMLVLGCLGAPVVRACPDCDIGQVARAQFWSDNFASNLAVAIAPFAVVIAASLLAERMGRRPQHANAAEVSAAEVSHEG
jgi:hypothetical protein